MPMTRASSERLRVRLASQAGAVALVLVAVFLALRPFAVSKTPETLIASGVTSVTIEQRDFQPTTSRAPRAPRIEIGTHSNAIATVSDGDGASHMWLDGTAGRVHFANEHEYLRCLDAALDHIQVENCPPPPAGSLTFSTVRQQTQGFRIRDHTRP